ncbi:glycoside hydrolase family 3 C-terminal domain-containing protein, partial [Escherichia coli]|uniref:glycoside hydrolase family 3 C-terminal domain-containing protein n=1 Tax=Escherichia coli TaxID=562 RepID=UPI003C09938F
ASKAERTESFDKESHHELAREVAEQSIVLLKNDGLLPLQPETSVAVVGEFAVKPRYQGAGSSLVNPTKLENA